MPDRSSDDLSPSPRAAALYKLLFDAAVTLADLRMPSHEWEYQNKVYRYHARRKALQELGDRWQQPGALQRTRRP